jgi:spermidine synthase
MTFPIILAHGACRFDKVSCDSLNIDINDNLQLDNLHYFRGVRTMLKGNGFVVYHSGASWAVDVHARADDLKKC